MLSFLWLTGVVGPQNAYAAYWVNDGGVCTNVGTDLPAAVGAANALGAPTLFVEGNEVERAETTIDTLVLRPGRENPLGGACQLTGAASITQTTRGRRLLTVTGTTTVLGITLSGNNATTVGEGGVIVVANGGDLTLSNSPVNKGHATTNGGCISVVGSLTLDGSSTVTSCTARFDGGGISSEGGTITMSGSSQVFGNQAKKNGGGIALANASLTMLTGSSVVGNTAIGRGGGIHQSGGAAITQTLANNTAFGHGGGIYAGNGAALLTDESMSKNVSYQEGGAVYATGSGTTVDLGSDTIDNHARRDGGGIRLTDAAAMSLHCDRIVLNTTPLDGGGIHADATSTIVHGLFISSIEYPLPLGTPVICSNRAGYNDDLSIANAGKKGGGIYLHDATMGIGLPDSQPLICDNRATLEGGGLAAYAQAIGTFEYATFSENQADAGRGGGILAEDAETRVTLGAESAILSNTAGTHGGGIAVNGAWAIATADGFEVDDNQADDNGGGIYVVGEEATPGRVSLGGAQVTLNNALDGAGGGAFVGAFGTLFGAGGGDVLTFSLNGAELSGGGVAVPGGTVDLNAVSFLSSNFLQTEGPGGGVAISDGGQFELTSGRVLFNHAGQGGGVHVDGGVLTLGSSECATGSPCVVVSGNTVDGTPAVGGGVAIVAAGSFDDHHLERVLFQGNDAGEGPGMWVDHPDAQVSILNSVLAFNDAPSGNPSGALTVNDGTVECVHCTIGLNEVGVDLLGGSMTAVNSIIDDNSIEDLRDTGGAYADTCTVLAGDVTLDLSPMGIPSGGLDEVRNQCVDEGPDNDIDNTARPHPDDPTGSPLYDRGAYELPGTCGDGVLDPGEDCDPVLDPSCPSDCQTTCGDGILQGNEQCEEALLDPKIPPEHCDADCQWVPYGLCEPEEPCESTWGDCDGDTDCVSGTICTDDVGHLFGWSAQVDVCIAQGDLPYPGDSFCSTSAPCDEGVGDCDSDSECKSGLVCSADVGANYGWNAGVDVCE